MIQVNMVDAATTNGCPEITPEQLLAEPPAYGDMRELERFLGRFNSTTVFLQTLKEVLFELDGFPEVDLLAKFIPLMAQVEAAAMNGDPSPNAAQSPKGDNELNDDIKARIHAACEDELQGRK